jgi:hypothetical protein
MHGQSDYDPEMEKRSDLNKPSELVDIPLAGVDQQKESSMYRKVEACRHQLAERTTVEMGRLKPPQLTVRCDGITNAASLPI